MRNKVIFYLCLLALSILVLLSGCGVAKDTGTNTDNTSNNDGASVEKDTNNKKEQFELIMSSEVPETHFKSALMKEFGEELEKRTDGGIKTTFFPAGQLYSDIDALRALGTDAVHSVWPVSVQLESFNPRYGVLTLPFAISDDQMLDADYKEDLLNLLSPLVEEQGMSVQGFLRTADLLFMSQDTEMKSYEDLSGMKIRMTGGQVLLEMANQLNASAVSIPASEMSTSLSQGVIDAIFSSPSGWKTILGPSVPYGYYIPGLSTQTYSVVFDQEWLNKLPEGYRTEIINLVDEITSKQWKEAIQDDEAILEELVDEGVTIHNESEENIEELKNILKPATDIFADEFPDIYEQFKQLNQE